jgi:uncharacterized RDD family membrane protein YckC
LSTSSSRLDLNLDAHDAVGPVPAWKQELNERLQAKRTRQARRGAEQASLPSLDPLSKVESRSARLAAKVAAHYANAPSYSEILAADARAAAEAAEAAVLTQDVCAAAQAPDKRVEECHAGAQASHDHLALPGPASDSAARSTIDSGKSACESTSPSQEVPGLQSLDDVMVFPPQPLPVNLIEFPRELVAARKARPRLAEGPLRENSEQTAHDQSQLRIFEVEAENISKAVKVEAAASEWSSIRLDAKPSTALDDEKYSSSLELPLKSAPLEDRLMAGILDAVLVLLAFVLFVLVFAACTSHPPSGKPALLAGSLALAGLFILYQYLFFRFTEGTPGMHYAKIALCTFEDENPTRKAMRRRILYLALSAAPLGLGFAWAWFDADRLGWHDRLSRMYQRSYR